MGSPEFESELEDSELGESSSIHFRRQVSAPMGWVGLLLKSIQVRLPKLLSNFNTLKPGTNSTITNK